jgi:hypothetical protein
MAASVAATQRQVVLVDQGQPGQQVIGLGQGRPELGDGPGDHLAGQRP